MIIKPLSSNKPVNKPAKIEQEINLEVLCELFEEKNAISTPEEKDLEAIYKRFDLNSKAAIRVKKIDPDSDGESDNEDPSILYRALRPEENPFIHGLNTPDGAIQKTPRAHISAGTRAKTKSMWVSASRSIKTPSAWHLKIPLDGRQ